MTDPLNQQDLSGRLGSGPHTFGAPAAPAPPPLAAAKRRLRKKLSPKSRKGMKIKQHPKSIESGKANLVRARAEKATQKPVTIQLRGRFTINSAPQTKVRRRVSDGKLMYEDVPGTGGAMTYGPGSVTVPQAIAQVLLEMQRNSEHVLASESFGRNTVVIDERRTRQVADEAQLNAFLGFGPVALTMRF